MLRAFRMAATLMELGQLRRRGFIALLGGVVAWPIAARAQQPALPVIGFLSANMRSVSDNLVAAFQKGLADSGYIEGQNIAVALDHHKLVTLLIICAVPANDQFAARTTPTRFSIAYYWRLWGPLWS